MSFKDIISNNENLAIKVKRYNPDSLTNRIGRWLDNRKHPTEKENHFFKEPDLREHSAHCGFLTAAVRRFDVEAEEYPIHV